MKRLVVLLAAAFALTGAGQASATAPPIVQCQSTDCVLAGQPAPSRIEPRVASRVLQGIDFAWTKFGPAAAGDFGASYASYDSSKDWSSSLIAQYHAAHKGTVVVFETSANRASAGCGAGISDATRGETLLASWGYARSHLDMAIDFDANGPEVAEYFRCATARYPGLIGAYGGYRPLAYLCGRGYIHKSWQTYAWSGGRWLPASCAPLEQWLNGSAFDHDRAIAADYGQFPTPTFGPSQATIAKWRKVRNDAFKRYHAQGCRHPQGTPTYCGLFGGLVVSYQAKLWSVYPRWSCFGHGARTKSQVCWIVRPQASYWSHAATATDRAMDLDRAACNGPAGFPAPSHTAQCNKLRQRRTWFHEHATVLVKAYS